LARRKPAKELTRGFRIDLMLMLLSVVDELEVAPEIAGPNVLVRFVLDGVASRYGGKTHLPIVSRRRNSGRVAAACAPGERGGRDMIRTIFVVAAIGLGVGIAVADQDPIAARKALMKANGDQAKIGAAMVKGEAPFDLDKVHKMFATFADAAAKMPALFPDNSKTGGETAADPKIWENMDDVKARFAKLGADAKDAAAKVTDLDSLKAAFGNIGKNDCGGCHEKYRVKKS
jgi:cytochrome c556